jgi:catechol 2,3-dioxygenase-like lactoylglutathione lyase family enzyme
LRQSVKIGSRACDLEYPNSSQRGETSQHGLLPDRAELIWADRTGGTEMLSGSWLRANDGIARDHNGRRFPGCLKHRLMFGCLVGTRPFFQIEMFEFARPRPRRLPEQHGLRDFGYSMFGIHVHDVDETLERIARAGGAPVTDPVGEMGARRACIRDADGVILELMEDWAVSDPLSAVAGQRHGPSIEFVLSRTNPRRA